MTLLEVLTSLSPVVTITADVTVLYYLIPAFKRTRNRAFLWLGCAALLGTFDTVCDYTIAIEISRKSHSDYVTYRTLRRLTYFANCAFYATGVVLLARGAMNNVRPADNSAGDRTA